MMHPRLDQIRHYQQQPQQQQQQQPQQQPQQEQRVWFERRRPEPRPDQERILYAIDEATLKAFVRFVYITAAIFILVTSITWLAISGAKVDFYKAVPVPYFVWILLAFLLLMMMNCVPQMRHIFPINWGITICIVILFILAGACLVGWINVFIVLGTIVGAVAIVAICYTCGALCPQRLLPGVFLTSILACIFVTALFILIILIIFIRNNIIGLVFAITLFCLVVIMMPFHAQYIHGRLEVLPMFEMLHSCLTIYIHFVLIFVSIDYLCYYGKLH